MEIRFSEVIMPESGCLVFLLPSSLKFSKELDKLDSENDGFIKKAIKSADFKGKKGKFLSVLGNVDPYGRLVLLGTGDDEEGIKTENDMFCLGGNLYAYLNKERVTQATLLLEENIGGFSPDFAASSLAAGLKLRSYHFNKYFTKQKDESKPALKKLTIALNASQGASVRYNAAEKVVDGVFLTRNLVSEPANVLYPESYAEICKSDLKSLGVKVDVLELKDLRKLGMGSLLGVAQGSVFEPKVVVMQWNGAQKKGQKPIAFVGKGVTFDTGGISIKPSENMGEMKYDMAGSGAVVGLMKALAGRKAQVNAIGVIGLVENMPDGNAQRPGDIVKSMSGQTIEVLNTDAEGRLVLADILWYTQKKFKPQFMVDLATLTGAIVVAVGDQYAGLFSNDDEISTRLEEAGKKVGEKLWRFPMGKEFDKMIDSKVADMQNIGNGRGAGSITAAQFLQRFVNDTPWAHLDIAGMAWTKKDLDVVPEGASGFGVRLLDRFVADYYES